MGVSSLVFSHLSLSFDPRVVPLWNCARSADNNNTGRNPLWPDNRETGPCKLKRVRKILVIFFFPSFFFHSPAPRMAPVFLAWRPEKEASGIQRVWEKSWNAESWRNGCLDSAYDVIKVPGSPPSVHVQDIATQPSKGFENWTATLTPMSQSNLRGVRKGEKQRSTANA